MSRPRFSIAIWLAITAVVILRRPVPAARAVARPDAAVVRRLAARSSAAR